MLQSFNNQYDEINTSNRVNGSVTMTKVVVGASEEREGEEEGMGGGNFRLQSFIGSTLFPIM